MSRPFYITNHDLAALLYDPCTRQITVNAKEAILLGSRADNLYCNVKLKHSVLTRKSHNVITFVKLSLSLSDKH